MVPFQGLTINLWGVRFIVSGLRFGGVGLEFRVLVPGYFLRGWLPIRRPWGACWMVAEGGEGENPLPFSLVQNAVG